MTGDGLTRLFDNAVVATGGKPKANQQPQGNTLVRHDATTTTRREPIHSQVDA